MLCLLRRSRSRLSGRPSWAAPGRPPLCKRPLRRTRKVGRRGSKSSRRAAYAPARVREARAPSRAARSRRSCWRRRRRRSWRSAPAKTGRFCGHGCASPRTAPPDAPSRPAPKPAARRQAFRAVGMTMAVFIVMLVCLSAGLIQQARPPLLPAPGSRAAPSAPRARGGGRPSREAKAPGGRRRWSPTCRAATLGCRT